MPMSASVPNQFFWISLPILKSGGVIFTSNQGQRVLFAVCSLPTICSLNRFIRTQKLEYINKIFEDYSLKETTILKGVPSFVCKP